MHAFLHLLQSAGSFLFVLGVLVSIRELGHYGAARACGVGVEAFSIGFGPALKKWIDGHGTVWKISALPLGGYVKMHGMVAGAEQPPSESGRVFRPDEAYGAKPVGQRAFIAAAGPLANFVLAAVIFALLFGLHGRVVQLPVVGQVVHGSAAESAGLQPNDRILSVNGQTVSAFPELRAIVAAHPDQDLALRVQRGGQAIDLTAHIQAVGRGFLRSGRLGVTSGAEDIEKMGPIAAIGGGISETWTLVADTFNGLVGLIANPQGAEELGGPIMIAQMSGQVAQAGLVMLATFIAALSVNLGLVNLLPIPVLDGGHLLFYAAEAVRGRPVPLRAQEYGYRVGIAFIACVLVMVSVHDLSRAGLFSWLLHLAG